MAVVGNFDWFDNGDGGKSEQTQAGCAVGSTNCV